MTLISYPAAPCFIGVASSLGVQSQSVRVAFDRAVRARITGAIPPPLGPGRFTELAPDASLPSLPALRQLLIELARRCCELSQQGRPFAVIGGDHACAIGTWSGVLNSLRPGERLGLIWLDAHLDVNDFASSPSGNIHGMPLAALLGHSDPALHALTPTARRLRPEHLVLIGARSYEPGEQALLQSLGARIIHCEAVRERGQLVEALVESMDNLARRCERVGISIDLDVLDPADACAVATPEPGGLRRDDLLFALGVAVAGRQLAAVEIAEYYPERDRGDRTLAVVEALCRTLLSRA